jgi:hydroxymethylglutaryl-CoA reductase
MSILSNYVPNCIVRAEVSCPDRISRKNILNPQDFAERFVQAVQIAEVEPFRAVTHNKGIMNVDAVVLLQAMTFVRSKPGFIYAAKSGQYSSLSHAKIENGVFTFWLEIPLARNCGWTNYFTSVS